MKSVPGCSSIESSPAASDRSISPSRALQAIREKLHKFAESPRNGLVSTILIPHVHIPVDVDEDLDKFERVNTKRTKSRDDDFDDVDQRLAALQEFLKAARNSIEAV